MIRMAAGSKTSKGGQVPPLPKGSSGGTLKPAEPRVVFVLRVFARPAMSRAIESVQIREALEKCRLEFGGGVGGILTGTIFGPADPFTQERPAWGKFDYSPSCPP